MTHTEPIKYEPLPGDRIADTCRIVAAMAAANGTPVEFRFNAVDVVVAPGETAAQAEIRWRRATEEQVLAKLSDPAYIAAEEQRKREQARRQRLASEAAARHFATALNDKRPVEQRLAALLLAIDVTPVDVGALGTIKRALSAIGIERTKVDRNSDPIPLAVDFAHQALDGILGLSCVQERAAHINEEIVRRLGGLPQEVGR